MQFPRILMFASLLSVLAGCKLAGDPPLVTECSSPKKMLGDRSGPALVGKEYGRQATPIPLDSIQFSNWPSARSVAVQQLFASRTATSTVQVTARFISCTNDPTVLKVRASFLDANQAPTEEASAWKTVIVQPRMTAVYSESSLSTAVANYLIEVMPGQ